MFGAVIGAMITLLCVKMWEKKVAAKRGRREKKVFRRSLYPRLCLPEIG